MYSTKQQKLPTLLFLLEYNKFADIIKAMLNKKISTLLLQEYGYKQMDLSSACQYRINKSVNRFSILQVRIFLNRKQLIEIKGFNLNSTKHYYNTILHETIRRKLFTEIVCPETRKQLWLQFTQYYVKPHFYADLKLLQIAEDFATVIEKDIKRTYKGDNTREKATQVLQLFCHYNPYVGYCQGMNNIVAFLISRGFTCQQSFFIFKQITEQLLPSDYYTNMDNIMTYTRIFYQMLNFTHHDVYMHLKKISMQMENNYAIMVSFALQWFVCLFCNDNIWQQVTQVIWDFFLLEGITVLFKAALAMFDILRPYILKCNDFESYNLMQKQTIKNIKDVNFIRQRIIQIYVSPQILYLLKEKLLQPKIQQNQSQKVKKPIKLYKKNCQTNSNVCFQALQINFQENKFYDFFVFKPNYQLKIIPNYLQTLNKQYFKNQKPKDKLDTLMIGRIEHVCRRSSNTMTEGSLSDKNKNTIDTTPNKSLSTSPYSNKTPTKQGQLKIREKICQRIVKVAKIKTGLSHSQSVTFMQEMARNVSISNLLEHYDMDELFQ